MSDFGEELFCSRSWASREGDQLGSHLLTFYKAVVFLFILLTITATLGNSLILAALHKESSLHPPSKLLFRSLAVTDLCVGAISQPFIVTMYFSVLRANPELCRVSKLFVYVTTTIFSGISLATLTTIGVDRLLALLLRLRYRQVVTVKRIRVLVSLFWLISTAVGTLYIWSAYLYFTVSAVSVLLFVAVSTYCYTRIFRTIRRQQTQVQDVLGCPSTRLNIARYKRTVFNALWVHLTLAACYLPFALTTVVIAVRGLSTALILVEGVTSALVYLNSSLNPVLYCWRIREIRQAVKETVGQVYAYFSA